MEELKCSECNQRVTRQKCAKDVGTQAGDPAPMQAYLSKEKTVDVLTSAGDISPQYSEQNGQEESIHELATEEEASSQEAKTDVDKSCSLDSTSYPDIGDTDGHIDPYAELGTEAELSGPLDHVVILSRSFESRATPKGRWKKAANFRKAVHRMSTKRATRRNQSDTKEMLASDGEESSYLSGGFRRVVISGKAERNGWDFVLDRQFPVENRPRWEDNEREERYAESAERGVYEEADYANGEIRPKTDASFEEVDEIQTFESMVNNNGSLTHEKTKEDEKESTRSVREGLMERQEECNDIDPSKDIEVSDLQPHNPFYAAVVLTRSFESAPLAKQRWNRLKNATTASSAFWGSRRTPATEDDDTMKQHIVEHEEIATSGYVAGGCRRISIPNVQREMHSKSKVRKRSFRMRKAANEVIQAKGSGVFKSITQYSCSEDVKAGEAVFTCSENEEL